jgi:hypothetical protein
MFLGQLAEDCLITDSIRVGIHHWRIRSSCVNDQAKAHWEIQEQKSNCHMLPWRCSIAGENST